MAKLFKLASALALAGLAALLGAACGGTPAPTAAPPLSLAQAPQATQLPDPFASVPGIVNPSNRGWPRVVEGLNGRVTVASKPQRIISASVGHDEMTYALVPRRRVVGVGFATTSDLYSNVAELAQGVPIISSDPETILAQRPDIVVTSEFLKADTVDALVRAGVPVVQTGLSNDPNGRLNDILLLGYIYGEEERAVELAREVEARYQAVTSVAQAAPLASRSWVLALTSYSDMLWTAGKGSVEGSIIEAAGGLNAAAGASIAGNQTISMESVIAMAPEVVIIPMPPEPAGEFRKKLLAEPALAQVPAIKNGRVYVVTSRFFTTLSFWNVRGVEEMAGILWPKELGGREFRPFSLPSGPGG